MQNDKIIAWTRQLYREYEIALFRYSIKNLRPCSIEISPVTSIYGLWDGESRTITIAENLIEQHPWNIVVEILKHEMAHQVAHELLNADGQTAHSVTFQRACKMLGVAPWAATATGALPTNINDVLSTTLGESDSRLLRKADKLFSLAASANEHEAQLAMERAQELLIRHNLTPRTTEKGFISKIIPTGKGSKREGYERGINAILVAHFFVYTITLRGFDAVTGKVQPELDIMGRPENVAMAIHVYNFLRTTANRLWDERASTSTGGKRMRERNSFMVGVIQGFRVKLNTAQRNVKVEGIHEALVLIKAETKKIEADIGRCRYPRVCNRRPNGTYDHDAYEAGKQAGGTIVLSKAVGSSTADKKLLLGR